MSQPVKLSDVLVLEARMAAEVQERSIAGQVEFWACLGRSVEQLLAGRQVMALRRNGGAESLSKALAAVETPDGRKRLRNVLASRPYPHFEQYPGHPGLLVRIGEDGCRTTGRFVNRDFVEVEPKTGQRKGSESLKKSSATPTVKRKLPAKTTETSHSKERSAGH